MKIIGLNNEMYISSACLLDNGAVKAAAAEERFTREKLTRKFPKEAVRYCLKEYGVDMGDIDYIATSWNPGIYFSKFNPILSGQRRHFVEQLYSIPDHIMHFYRRPKVDYVYQEIRGRFGVIPIYYITHHRAHAANGFFLSGFEKAAILTADAQGEFESATFCRGKGNRIEYLKSLYYPHSLGALYSTFTEFLGFRPNSDEWKVMAMAAYAASGGRFYRTMKEKVVRLRSSGEFELDLSYFKGYIHEQPNLYTDKLIKDFGGARASADKITDRHYEIAAALQRITEETLAHMLRYLHKETKEKNLILSGGTFMNSVFNGKVLELVPFDKVFISSCPDDSGNCFGAALYLYRHILGKSRTEMMSHNYFGPQYTDIEIRDELDKFRLSYVREKDIAKKAATLIGEGKIIGWFQGRMEFGQRALGNRSILADPRRADVKDKVNSAIKFREGFRPFAPAILRERQNEYFDTGRDRDSRFMEKVYMVRSGRRKDIPAVVHIDGSGRVQTVDKETNLRFHSLIREFERTTGVPVVLNTSFNLNDEPIVCSPRDAIRTFYSSALDCLLMGDYMIQKESVRKDA